MTDYFALLGQTRRPWLDPEQLKERFHTLSRELHPDRAQSGAMPGEDTKNFAEINAAYNCLREPRERLRHLLQLEVGDTAKPARAVPSGLMDVSMEVGAICRAADQFLAMQAAESSALMRAQMFEEGQELSEKLMQFQQRLEKGRGELLEEVRALDAAWENPNEGKRRDALVRLGEIESLLGFTGRWIAQLQERVVRLAM